MTKDSTQEAPKDVVAYSEILGYRNYMYLPQELKNAIAKAYKHYRTLK